MRLLNAQHSTITLPSTARPSQLCPHQYKRLQSHNVLSLTILVDVLCWWSSLMFVDGLCDFWFSKICKNFQKAPIASVPLTKLFIEMLSVSSGGVWKFQKFRNYVYSAITKTWGIPYKDSYCRVSSELSSIVINEFIRWIKWRAVQIQLFVKFAKKYK